MSTAKDQAEAGESALQEKLVEAAKALGEAETQATKERDAWERAEAEARAAQERLAAVARESKALEVRESEAREDGESAKAEVRAAQEREVAAARDSKARENRESALQEKLVEAAKALEEAETRATKERDARERAEAEARAAQEREVAAARESKGREARESKFWEARERGVVAFQLLLSIKHASLLEESRSAQARLSEALKEAEASARSRDEFLAVMNHEIRTPLHAITALLSLLSQSELTEDQQSMLQTVSKSTTLLCALINNVLDFSRLADDNLALDPHPFHFPSLFEQLEALAGSMAQAKGVRLVVRIDEGIPHYVLGDDQRILQVLLNLVANSVKFTERGGCITIEASKVESESSLDYAALKVTVADTGMGIRPENLHKLFQKFVQADASITRKHGGSGLGLAICKKLVEMMQGRIWLESEGLGRGCTASFVILLQHGRAPEALEAPLLRSTALKGLRALVTDDNAINRLVTSRLLTTLGCEVGVAESGRRCLEQLAAQRFGLVLLDLSMPEMDGFQVFESIKRTYPPPVRPLVVALTANSDQRTRDLCMEVGMDAIILKPVTVSDFREALCSVLESSIPVANAAPEVIDQ
jgi:signal transduction histidine kinase